MASKERILADIEMKVVRVGRKGVGVRQWASIIQIILVFDVRNVFLNLCFKKKKLIYIFQIF